MVKKRELTAAERSIIFNRRSSGESLSSIAKDFGLTKEGVRKVYMRLRDRENAENSPRSGRPRKTAPQTDRRILIEVKKTLKLQPIN